MTTRDRLTRQTQRLFRHVVPPLLGLLLLGGFAFHTAEAQSSTTRYVGSGNCANQTPCYPSIGRALSQSSSGDVLELTSNISENDLYGTTWESLANITIESMPGTGPFTDNGGTNFYSTNNWTFQNINFTADLYTESAPNGWTVNNVHAQDIVAGNDGTNGGGVIGGTISISNCALTGTNGQVEVLGADGKTINGSITISHCTNVNYINVFSFVKSGSQSDMAANVTIDSNFIISGAQAGVWYRGNNTGNGNVTGNVTITNNTTTAYQGVISLDIQGRNSSGYTTLHGNVTGTTTIANNNTYKIAILTSDETTGDLDGPISVHDNTAGQIEIGSNAGINTSISVLNNTIYWLNADTFITLYSCSNPGNVGCNDWTGSIDVENNSRNLPNGAQYSTGIIARAFSGAISATTTISNNVAYHIIYESHTANGAAFTINGNTISGVNPSNMQNDGYITIQSDVSTLGNGTVAFNHATSLQVTANQGLSAGLNFTSNTFDNETDLLSQAGTGSGTLTMIGNRINKHLYVVGLTAQIHFNSILGQFDTNSSPAFAHAEQNWWGCNNGYNNGSPCQAGTHINGGYLEPHLIAKEAVTCTVANDAGVAFNLQNDNTNALQMSSIAPATATISTSTGNLGAGTVPLRNGAGSTTIGLPSAGGSPTATVRIDSQTLTASATCNSSSTRPDTVGVYRSGTFLLRNQNTTGFADLVIPFSNGSQPYPIVGDWTGGGIDTIGNFDQASGNFFLRDSNTAGNPDQVLTLGNANDQPISGRWLLTGTHDGVGVFRPTNGLIYLKSTLTTGFADASMLLGLPGDVGIANDWNGDGIDSPGVFRPTASAFYLSDQTCNCTVFADRGLTFGTTGDAPFTGDWTGQGHAGVGTFRVSTGVIFLKNQLTTGFADMNLTYGIGNDVPVAGHWIPPVPIAPPAQAINSPSPNVLIPPATHTPLNSSAPGDNQIGG